MSVDQELRPHQEADGRTEVYRRGTSGRWGEVHCLLQPTPDTVSLNNSNVSSHSLGSPKWENCPHISHYIHNCQEKLPFADTKWAHAFRWTSCAGSLKT
jgi:hypothetical protein